MSDNGHETVGQALLITGVAISALTAAQLGQLVVHTLSTFMLALSR